MSDKHVGMYENDWNSTTYQAVCTCGWRGTAGAGEQQAKDELERHYAESGAT